MSSPQITLYWFPLSHPAQAAKRMLDYKGLEYSKVTIPAGMQPIVMRAAGFPGITVPALKVDGERVQGSTDISRRLEEIKPEPSLYGGGTQDGDQIREAELWGERELQPTPRRVYRWLGSHDQAIRAATARAVGAPGPIAAPAGAAMIVPFRALARLGGASDENVRAHLTDLPANLDHADQLLEAGVIGGDHPNAADFQIASSIHALLAFSDLRPYIQNRPCESYALGLMGGPPRAIMPAGLPADWLPTLSS